jgi:hypothetical protein
MKSQKGAALIVVLSLLTISLMVGLSSMQSSQIDERLAGNYRAQTDAQMHAERVASELFERISVEDHADKKELAKNFDDLSVGFGWQEISGLAAGPDYSDNCHALDGPLGVACFVEVADGYLGLEQGSYIIAMGAVGDGGSVAVSEPVLVEVDPSGGGVDSPFSDGVIGCEGVVVNGGGNIDSRVRTLSENADVSLTGGTYVEGDVLATGGVYTDGSGGAGGDIRANKDVNINASVAYGGVFSKGNVFLNNTAQFSGGVSADGDVEFNNGATLGGSLSAGGDVTFANTGAFVEGSVTAAGEIHNNFDSWKETGSFAGGGVSSGAHSSVAPVPIGECDEVSLPSVVEEFTKWLFKIYRALRPVAVE